MPTISRNLTHVNRYVGTNSPKWIVVHNSANCKSYAGMAYNNTVYFKDVYREASAHYFIDDGDVIWQCVKDTDSAWHVGDSWSRNGCTNYNSIGIEVCENADGSFTANEIKNLSWLVQKLMKQYNIPASRVCRHYDVTTKNCPRYYTNDTRWNALKQTITGDTPQVPGTRVNTVGMAYRVHCQTYGWLPAVRDGQTAGTVGKSKRVEAVKMTPPVGVVLTVEVHIQGKGWVKYEGVERGVYDPVMGTVGQSLRIEAVRIRCVENNTGKQLKYRAHVQGVGWQPWQTEGGTAGTTGQSKRLEAIQIEFV